VAVALLVEHQTEQVKQVVQAVAVQPQALLDFKQAERRHLQAKVQRVAVLIFLIFQQVAVARLLQVQTQQ
jgi:hypothetical protein